ncbi:SAF domain-containing protein [Agromyces sp. Leaf222]|uniref:SAF domain-containing protein n=1 Tax=Agromyces sp. Leaf222 TaxID=1735688 RepID=UPI0009EC2352|nr:SAF domain-containing protein [Agromyces sp. Leaf222]
MPRRSERGSIRIDPRLVIGIVLIAGSTAGVYALVSGLDDATEVYTATETLTPGDRIRPADLVVERVRFGSAEARYLEPDAVPEEGLIVTSTIRAGELVPLGAVDDVDRAGLATVVVTSRAALPEGVDRGSVVDVWSTRQLERGAVEPPSVLVPEAEVAAVTGSSGMVDSGGVSVELLVPRERVAALLEALAADDTIDLVPARPEVDR